MLCVAPKQPFNPQLKTWWVTLGLVKPGRKEDWNWRPFHNEVLCQRSAPALCFLLCDSGIPHGAGPRAALLPEALAMVDKPTVKTFPIAQAFDSTINLTGIFTVPRTGHFFFFYCFDALIWQFNSAFPLCSRAGKEPWQLIFSGLLLIFKTLTVLPLCWSIVSHCPF